MLLSIYKSNKSAPSSLAGGSRAKGGQTKGEEKGSDSQALPLPGFGSEAVVSRLGCS